MNGLIRKGKGLDTIINFSVIHDKFEFQIRIVDSSVCLWVAIWSCSE